LKRGTIQHPKTYTLAAVLNVPLWGAVGILESLWHFAQRYAAAGDVGRFSDEAIARAIGWQENPATLVSGLAQAGWVDRCSCHRVRIHDWHEHADQTTKRAVDGKYLPCYQDPTAMPANASESIASASGKLAAVAVAVPCLAVAEAVPLPERRRLDLETSDALYRARLAEQTELLRTVGRLGELTGRDPPEIMRQVTAYKRPDGTVVRGKLNPAELSADRVTKSLEDAKAWVVSEEKKRETGRAGPGTGHRPQGVSGAG
jgi:hypothetical protein